MNAKRYNCSNTLDYGHELQRMCSSINDCWMCPIHHDSGVCKSKISSESISAVQNWSDTHPEIEDKERPVLTENDVHILVALQVMGYHWIAKNKVTFTDSFDTYAFVSKPEWDKECGCWIIDDRELTNIKNSTHPIAYNFPFLSYKDTEATSIDWLLSGDE